VAHGAILSGWGFFVDTPVEDGLLGWWERRDKSTPLLVLRIGSSRFLCAVECAFVAATVG
jgi:hypothetical protein